MISQKPRESSPRTRRVLRSGGPPWSMKIISMPVMDSALIHIIARPATICDVDDGADATRAFQPVRMGWKAHVTIKLHQYREVPRVAQSITRNTPMSDNVNWGIISTGAIAKTFARGLPASKTGRLVAVASRSQDSADAFAGEFGGASVRAHSSYESILNDQNVQAVYIATPHPMHAEWAIRAARAGKHVLVEKPAGINHAQLMAMIEVAIDSNVFFMEAFMYRCHPQTARLLELLREKAIGDVRVIQSTFSFHGKFNPQSRLFANDMAGGGIMDIGCYPVSIARLIAGGEPTKVRGVAHLGETGVDEWAAAVMQFPGDVIAQVSAGMSVGQDNSLRIYGSEGRIIVPNPFVANRTAPDHGKIILQRRDDKQPQEIAVEAAATSFTYEADVAGNAILAGHKQAPAPAMTWNDSLGNLRVLDQWRESIGLEYGIEKPSGHPKVTVSGTPLRFDSYKDVIRNKPALQGRVSGGNDPDVNVRLAIPMQYGRVEGVDKPISR